MDTDQGVAGRGSQTWGGRGAVSQRDAVCDYASHVTGIVQPQLLDGVIPRSAWVHDCCGPRTMLYTRDHSGASTSRLVERKWAFQALGLSWSPTHFLLAFSH